MLKKREEDWLSAPVLAAAAVNPVYIYSSEPIKLWPFAGEPACDRAVATVIKKLMWGDTDGEAKALDGWDRYHHREGIYALGSEEREQLENKAKDPVSFFRHVARSTLECDRIFAKEIAIPLVCGFACQGASEHVNKYMVDSAGDKKRSGLDLDKSRNVLDLKMHLMYQKARKKADAAEQKLGERSIAADLRAVYETTRERAGAIARLYSNWGWGGVGAHTISCRHGSCVCGRGGAASQRTLARAAA